VEPSSTSVSRIRGAPENAAIDVFSLLAQAIDSGEIADVIGQLPAGIKELWPEGMRTWAAKRGKA